MENRSNPWWNLENELVIWMGEVTRKTTVCDWLSIHVQYNCRMRFRMVCIGVTWPPLKPPSFIYYCSVEVLVMANVRENLCDVYTIWQEFHFVRIYIFQPSTFPKPARESSYLNSEEDIASGRGSTIVSLSNLFTAMDRFRQKQKQKEYNGTRNLPDK